MKFTIVIVSSLSVMSTLSGCTDYSKPFEVGSHLEGCEEDESLEDKAQKLLLGEAEVICLNKSYSRTKLIANTVSCVSYVRVGRTCENGGKEMFTDCSAHFRCEP